MELVLGGAALSLLRARGYPIARLLPIPSVRGGLIGIGLFVAALLAWGLVAALFAGSDFARQPIADIMAATQVSTPWVVALSIVNGLYEETFLVGYLLRGFRASGPALAIGVSVLVRLLYHLYQGPIGAVSVLVFGVVVSLFYWRTGRLWPIVVAHVLADLLAFG
jgi:membrane protease YdiL (CAAX protease family)